MTTHWASTDRRKFRELCDEARDAWARGLTASLPIASFLEAVLGHGIGGVTRIEMLLADQRRMDYLDDEEYREECWRDAGHPSAPPPSLFRQNMPITREAIDAAIEREKGKGA